MNGFGNKFFGTKNITTYFSRKNMLALSPIISLQVTCFKHSM